MKLKPGGKIFLFLLLGVIAFFLIRKYMPASKTDNTTDYVDNPAKSGNDDSKDAGSDKKDSKGVAKSESRSFDYTPEKLKMEN